MADDASSRAGRLGDQAHSVCLCGLLWAIWRRDAVGNSGTVSGVGNSGVDGNSSVGGNGNGVDNSGVGGNSSVGGNGNLVSNQLDGGTPVRGTRVRRTHGRRTPVRGGGDGGGGEGGGEGGGGDGGGGEGGGLGGGGNGGGGEGSYEPAASQPPSHDASISSSAVRQAPRVRPRGRRRQPLGGRCCGRGAEVQVAKRQAEVQAGGAARS